LGPGDVLGIYVEGVLGRKEEPPPVLYSKESEIPPAIGYPIAVEEDGTISLPLISPVAAKGRSLADIKQDIERAYTSGDESILRKGRDRVIVTLLNPRTYHILVVREDSGPPKATTLRQGVLEAHKRGETYTLDLPAYQNDVFHALAESGGLPGADAKAQVTIYRAAARQPSLDVLSEGPNEGDGASPLALPEPEPVIAHLSDQPLTIPLRVGPGDIWSPLSKEDITLNSGDMVVVESRESEVYYTGGLLHASQFPLPRDYDLDVLQALAAAGGSVAAAAGGSGSRVGPGGFLFPPTRLIVIRTINGRQEQIKVNLKRALEDSDERILVQPHDFLLLEYTTPELVGNVILNNTLVSFGFSMNDLLRSPR
jgi:protein involved in polysaccharide export with SLBB domain